jgi:hypothetical protein
MPGPPTIVVSKASGAVRTFVGAMVPLYRRENDQRSNAHRIGVGEHPDGQLAYLRLGSASGVLAALQFQRYWRRGCFGRKTPAISLLHGVEPRPHRQE